MVGHSQLEPGASAQKLALAEPASAELLEPRKKVSETQSEPQAGEQEAHWRVPSARVELAAQRLPAWFQPARRLWDAGVEQQESQPLSAC
jgi:hypothetical protein